MGWTLRDKNGKTRIESKKILGRKLFPDDKKMSHAHAEFRVEGDKLYVRDLGSANGTFVQGRPLGKNVETEVMHGDLIMLGQTKFVAQLKEQKILRISEDDLESSAPKNVDDEGLEFVWPALSVLVFIGILAFIFGQPGMAMGHAIGTKLTLIVLAIATTSTVLIALPLNAVFLKIKPTYATASGFVITLSLGAAFAYSLLAGALDDRFPFYNAMTAQKMQYFCIDKPDRPMCVQQISHCPTCMAFIEKWVHGATIQPAPTATSAPAPRDPAQAPNMAPPNGP